MAKAPPLLPTEVLRRVLRVAQVDGVGLLVFAGGFALISAWYHDTTGAAAGLLISGAGAIELHGTGLLRHGREKGVSWLVASQLYLMAAVVAYAVWRLAHVDVSLLRPFVTDQMRQMFAQYNVTETDFLTFLYALIYGALGVLTVAYQGGMAFYYLRRRSRLCVALRELFGESQH